MKKPITYLFIFYAFICHGQQTINYIQYIFNKGVVNPAASGTNVNQKLYYTLGMQRQWVGFSNAPKQNFVNLSFNIRPPRSYSYWQNFGITIEADQSGTITNMSYYLNYSIHLLLRQNLIASFGVHAGIRNFFLSPGAIDPKDPIMQNSTFATVAYPDIVPGLRLTNRKSFFDISARQVSVIKQKNYFNHNQIADGSKLLPTIFMAYGRVIPLTEHWIMLPSVGIISPMLNVPSVNPTIMFYYNNQFGFGAATRNISLVSAIFQMKIFKNLSVGIAYAYTINRANAAAPNSYEVMIGVSPMGMSDKQKGRHSIAKCPTLDF